MNKLRIKQGQFGGIHSHNFTAIGIHFFMNLLRWTRFEFKPFWAYILNHSLSGCPFNEIIEAEAKGTIMHEFDGAYKGRKNVTFLIYEYPWSEDQLAEKARVDQELKGRPYQFFNFLQWPIRIFTFGLFWLGRRGKEAMNKTYCIEDQIIELHRMTAPGLAITDTDRQIHRMTKQFWKPSPLLYMQILKKYFTLVAEYRI